MTVILNCEQGDDLWHRARLGVVTASGISRIVTPKGALSAQRGAYMADLLAEWALGEAQDVLPDLYWIERGKALEDEARAFYELQTDTETRRVGFVYKDERRLIGCSPDWLCGEDGGAEVKCPKAGTHVSYLLGGKIADTYVPQVQASLWITGRAWWDFVSYYPGLPPLVARIERDPDYQGALNKALPQFLGEMLAARDSLARQGVRAAALQMIRDTQARDALGEILDAPDDGVVRDLAGLPVNPLA